jgi:DNA-binding transcriptional LysR family regulator
MILNVNQPRSLYAAEKSGGITKAAQGLIVTPAAITAQIKRLEEDIGLTPMFRSAHSIGLTDSGTVIFEEVRKIFVDPDDLERLISNMSKRKSGELRLGCSETSAVYDMPKLVTAFQLAIPNVKVIRD